MFAIKRDAALPEYRIPFLKVPQEQQRRG